MRVEHPSGLTGSPGREVPSPAITSKGSSEKAQQALASTPPADVYARSSGPTSGVELNPAVSAAGAVGLAAAVGAVKSRWVGGVTHESASLVVKASPGAEVRWVLAPKEGSGAETAVTAQADAHGMARLVASGLPADSAYSYRVEVNGQVDTAAAGGFTTFPKPGAPASFDFAFASCARSGSNHPVFDAIRALEPRFMVHMGDMHYSNIGENDPEQFQRAYDRVLSNPRQAALYANVPTVALYDDHDYSNNNGDKTSPSRPAVRTTYRERVPHYGLPAGPGDAPIYQSFVVGRVRFILSDLRSERDPASEPDDANKSMMGEAQLEWFKRELAQPEPVKVWVSSVPWNVKKSEGNDAWGGYDTERQEIIRRIKEAPGSLFICSGDAHMLAADDGTNSPGKIPLAQGGPLDQVPSLKGGPYSHGWWAWPGQFGHMSVKDDGEGITLHFQGRNHAGDVKVEMTQTFDAPASPPAS